jgi:hypothetical protein
MVKDLTQTAATSEGYKVTTIFAWTRGLEFRATRMTRYATLLNNWNVSALKPLM